MYGSLEELTVWAEWAQATAGGVAPEDDPRWLCVFEADLSVLDFRRPEVRQALDLTIDDLLAGWAPGAPNTHCLRVSVATVAARGDAFIVPSAAKPGAWNLDVLPAGRKKLRRLRRERMIPMPLPLPLAGVAEQADATDLNSVAREGVRVRTPAPARPLDDPRRGRSAAGP